MPKTALKLKQASAVLGVTPKDLQNMVQLGVIRPPRRRGVYWFDRNLLLTTKVAFYLKESLGSSSDMLARFAGVLAPDLGKKIGPVRSELRLASRPQAGEAIEAVEIKIPLRSLAKQLNDRLSLAETYKDLPRGRKRAGWKAAFSRSLSKAAADLGAISEKDILESVRQNRQGRRKPPEIAIVGRTKKKTA